MAPGKNALLNPREIDFYVVRSDVNQYDFKTKNSRSAHHLEVIPTGESGFNCEALRSRE